MIVSAMTRVHPLSYQTITWHKILLLLLLLLLWITLIIIAFDEGERILIVSFYANHSQGFYGPVQRGKIVMPCDFGHWAPFWTGGLVGWLAGRLCGTNSLDLMCNCKRSQLELLMKLSKLLKEREKVSSD